MQKIQEVTLKILECKEREFVRELGHQADDWAWCLHCERYYQVKNMRFEVEILGGQVIPWLLCAYPDCDGDVMDIFRKWQGKGSPILGKVYPLYPKK